MKNVQVIDGAVNCVYDIFALDDDAFAVVFPSGQDVAFIDEVVARVGAAKVDGIMSRLWAHRVRKCEVAGIHGTLFYDLEHKKDYYPDRTDAGARNPDGTLLR